MFPLLALIREYSCSFAANIFILKRWPTAASCRMSDENAHGVSPPCAIRAHLSFPSPPAMRLREFQRAASSQPPIEFTLFAISTQFGPSFEIGRERFTIGRIARERIRMSGS